MGCVLFFPSCPYVPLFSLALISYAGPPKVIYRGWVRDCEVDGLVVTPWPKGTHRMRIGATIPFDRGKRSVRFVGVLIG